MAHIPILKESDIQPKLFQTWVREAAQLKLAKGDPPLILVGLSLAIVGAVLAIFGYSERTAISSLGECGIRLSDFGLGALGETSSRVPAEEKYPMTESVDRRSW